MAIKPEIGELGNYYSSDCSLRAELVSYEEVDGFHVVAIRILKNLDPDTKQEYRERDIFNFRKRIDDKEDLEGLILDSGLRI